MKQFTHTLCLFLFVSVMSVYESDAQVFRAFDERFSINARGDVDMIGNTLVTCAPGGSPDCADVQAGTVSGHNGNLTMEYINIDPGAGFDNSSSADLDLPSGVTVLYAGLYWGGRANPSDPSREEIQLRVAGSSTYQTVNADELDTITNQGGATSRPYQGFADVTSLVEAAGNGTYYVGDLTTIVGPGDGLGYYGGWALVVIYEDTSLPFRNITLFDGAVNVSSGNDATVNISGILTPLSGAFDTFLGALVWEGDDGINGDQFSLDGSPLSDAVNPSTNFWNSTVSRLGSHFTDKNPNYVNHMAVDLDYVDASGILANGATTADIEFTTTGDVYFPHMVTFIVDLFVPDLVTSFDKDAVDLNGGDLLPGDIIEYTVTYENTGQDGATDVVLTDPIPAHTTYVPNSLVIIDNAGGTTGSQTDASGDDLAEFDPVENRVVFRLGNGADQNDGGLVSPSQAAEIQFRVRVNNNIATYGQTISNVATIDYSSETLPDEEFSGDTDIDVTVAPRSMVITNPMLPSMTRE